MDKKAILEQLNSKIKDCDACPLNNGYGLAVPGVGDINPDIMIVAEAPGAEESMHSNYPNQDFGKPLVGPAGHEFQLMLDSLGYSKYKLFVTNVLKHRPYNNAPPTNEQKKACMPFLLTQMITLNPKVIICLGKHASETVRVLTLQEPIPEGLSARGQDYDFTLGNLSARVFSTYHPSYACLRRPEYKRFLIEDLVKVIAYLGLEGEK